MKPKSNQEWKEKDEQVMLQAYPRMNVAMSHGEGSRLVDVEGREYIDLFSGVGVNLLGYNHPALVKAATKQVVNVLHLPFHFVNPLAVTHAEKLITHSIPGKVFYTTSGSEATEAVLKMIYKWKNQQLDPRNGIVVLKGSFHGRTLGSLQFTRQPSIYQDFPRHSLTPYEVERENLAQFQEVMERERPVAVMMEPVLGSGGVYPLSTGYLEQVEAICKRTNTLLIIDEIQSGMGRTGKLFAYQHTTITPDAILFGKGAGGGTALGGVIAGKALEHVFNPGDHGTTFAHPPISTALGLAVLDTLLDDGLMERGRETAVYLHQHLVNVQSQFPHLISDVRGRGMMFGLTLNQQPSWVASFQKELLEAGVLVDITQGNVMRLLPPLVITHEEIDAFVLVLTNHLEQYH